MAVKRRTVVPLLRNGTPGRRRASKACLSCRARKIRCDVVERGIGCTNCHLDELECVLGDTKRGRRPHTSRKTTQSPLPSVCGRRKTPEDESQEEIKDTEDVQWAKMLSPEVISLSPRRRFRLQSPPWSAITLPSFIRCLPPSIATDGIEYLEKKGALIIPNTTLRNELLRSYINYVHPYLPILDLNDFLRPIERNDGTEPVNLLLFQAVMFAGIAYIDMQFLQAQGYGDRRVAQMAFFQRVRLLYSLNYESDRISVLQSLLLMTYWYETPEDQKDTWHWMATALSLAYSLGLHRDLRNSDLGIKRKRNYRRIWWCCFVRDHLIALGMRRATQIQDEYHDVPILALEDFETERFSPKIIRMVGRCTLMEDQATRIQLAKMCVAKVKLCLCMKHVFTTQYSIVPCKRDSTLETNSTPLNDQSATIPGDIICCDQELVRWYRSVADEFGYQASSSQAQARRTELTVITVHRALLNMVFLTTLNILHRPQLLPLSASTAIPESLQNLAARRVREAAAAVTKITHELLQLDMVKYLPSIGVMVLLPAVNIHLLDLRSNDRSNRDASLRRLHQSIQVLQGLREVHASADLVTSLLSVLVCETNTPMAAEESPAESQFTKFEQETLSSTDIPTTLYEYLAHQPNTHGLELRPLNSAPTECSNHLTALSPDPRDGVFNLAVESGSPVPQDNFILIPNQSDDDDDDEKEEEEEEEEETDFDAFVDFDNYANVCAT